MARAKARRVAASGREQVEFIAGDLLALPFADGRFSAVTVAFGVRNVSDLPLALSEMKRVTAAGGHVVILEITQPVGPVGRRFSAFWFDRCVPVLGGMIAGDLSAYSYLPASVRAFPNAETLAGLRAAVRAWKANDKLKDDDLPKCDPSLLYGGVKCRDYCEAAPFCRYAAENIEKLAGARNY